MGALWPGPGAPAPLVPAAAGYGEEEGASGDLWVPVAAAAVRPVARRTARLHLGTGLFPGRVAAPRPRQAPNTYLWNEKIHFLNSLCKAGIIFSLPYGQS